MTIATCVFVVLFLIDVSMISSQIITQTPCEDFGTKPMEPFNKNSYDGQWFIHQLYDFRQSESYNCYIQIRTPTSDGNQNITEIILDAGGVPTFRSDGVTTFDPDRKGLYTYSNPDHPEYASTWEILDTDYLNYAVEWSCTEETPGYYSISLFIMSRLPVVTPFTQSNIDKILPKNIDKTELRTLNITSCPAQLLHVPAGPGLLGRVLEIVAGLLNAVVGVVGGLLGGILG